MPVQFLARTRLVCLPWILASSLACSTPERSIEPAPPNDCVVLSERVRHSATGIVLIRIPAGTFMMGSPPSERERDSDEELHEVVIESPFYLGETEVTIGQWNQVMGIDPFDAPARLDLPIGNVSWYDAREFLRRLNEQSDGGWRLPTEAEWEYACRAGTWTPFSFGEDVLPTQVNYNDRYPYAHERGTRSTEPVPAGSLPANPWGLHEMHGNVREWCQDLYQRQHGAVAAAQDTPGASRALRGGDFFSSGHQLRSAYRDGYSPNTTADEYGLRVARSIAPGDLRMSAISETTEE